MLNHASTPIQMSLWTLTRIIQICIAIIATGSLTGCFHAQERPIQKAMRSFLMDGDVERTASLIKAIRADRKTEGCDALRAELLVMQMLLTLDAPNEISTPQAKALLRIAPLCTQPSIDDSIWLYLYLRSEKDYESLPLVLRSAGSAKLTGLQKERRTPDGEAIREVLERQSPSAKDAIARILLDLYLDSAAGPAKDKLLGQAETAREATEWRGGVLHIPIYINTATNEAYGNFPKAEKSIKKLIDLLQRLGPAFLSREMDAVDRQAVLEIASGSYSEAVELCREVRKRANRFQQESERLYNILYALAPQHIDSAGPFHKNLVKVLEREGDALLQADRLEEAIQLGTGALQRTGEDKDAAESASHRLALYLQEAGRAEESESKYSPSLRQLVKRARLVGSAYPSDLNEELSVYAIAIHNFALLKMQQNKFDEAETILRLLLKIDLSRLPAQSSRRVKRVIEDVWLTLVVLSYDDPRRGRSPAVTNQLRTYGVFLERRLTDRLDVASPRRRYGFLRELQNRPSLVRAIVDRHPTVENVSLAYENVLLLKGRLFDLQRKDLGTYRDRSDQDRLHAERLLDKDALAGRPGRSRGWTTNQVQNELSNIQDGWRRSTSQNTKVLLLDYSFRKQYDPLKPFPRRLDNQIYELYVLQPDAHIQRFPVGTKTKVEHAVKDLRDRLSKVPSGNKDTNNAIVLMSDLLLPPEVKEMLSRLPENSLIIISPDKSLHGVPFTALLQSGQPLVARFALTSATSARELKEFEERNQSFRPPVALARSASDPSLGLPAIIPTPAFRNTMKLYSTAFLEGHNVTKENLLAAIDSPSLLALFLHGFSGESKRDLWAGYDLPSTALLEIETAEMALHGYRGDADVSGTNALRGFEIARLKLDQTQWAVLASCRSTWGPLIPGEGPMALSRAFRLAGAQSVTGSLWEADLNATLQLVDSMLASSLRQEHRTPVALAFANAVRALLQDPHFKEPYYWAPHVLVGNPYPLNMKRR